MIVILYYMVTIYELILLARILISWIRPNPYHPVVRWIYRLTEPVLGPVRRVLPIRGAGIDFSPLIVFLLLYMLKRVLFGGSYVIF